MNRKLVTSGLLAGLIAGSGAGLILQSTGFAGAAPSAAVVVVDDETSTTDATTDSTTDSTTDATDRSAERTARLTEVLQPLVDDGTITAAQLATIVETLDAAGPMGGGHRGGGGMGRGMGLDVAAEALGLTADELRTELSGGQTLAEIAAAQSVDVQVVIDALVAEATTHLAEHVTDGDLTQAEADEKLADLTERITTAVNDGGGFGRDGGRGGHGGRGGDRDGSADADADA